MKALLSRLVRRVDLRDIHCYGGASLAAVGISLFDPRIAVVCLGVFIAWLGVRR